MAEKKLYDVLELQKMWHAELVRIAKVEFNLQGHTWSKQTLIYSILNEQSKQDGNNLR